MRKYVNNVSKDELTVEEYNSMVIREYTEQWNEEYPNLIVMEFKEEGKTLQDYINYQLENDIDTDYTCVEE